MSAPERVLTERQLRHTVLARQLLQERRRLSLPLALERVSGLQSQYAPTMYVGLWSRLQGFQRTDLTVALQRRTVVQGTLMRATIHLVSAADYWPLALAIRQARRRWWLRLATTLTTESAVVAAAERVGTALATDGPLTSRELEQIAGPDAARGIGLWIDLVRAPPSGTWERRRADLFAAATEWVGPEPELAPEHAMDHLVRRYLTGFGPSTANDIALWAGTTAGDVAPSLSRLPLRRFRREDGQALVDLPRQPIPEPTRLPVRFLATWEAVLLAHARRTGVLREEDRPRIFSTKTPHSMNTFLVDGVVAGTWRFEDGRVETAPWRRLAGPAAREVALEAERLAEFHR